MGRRSSRPPGPPPGNQGSRGADTARRGRPRDRTMPRRTRGLGCAASLTCAPGQHDGRWLGIPGQRAASGSAGSHPGHSSTSGDGEEMGTRLRSPQETACPTRPERRDFNGRTTCRARVLTTETTPNTDCWFKAYTTPYRCLEEQREGVQSQAHPRSPTNCRRLTHMPCPGVTPPPAAQLMSGQGAGAWLIKAAKQGSRCI
uniref:Uncharacterized protein n=1 Tax=Molossus molossus TaxID=27622 RepID=A0A7J8FA58_MOLMO|nr:hypothetical protein HJG59_008569 [Molossus molossus]